jgi:hypothetical protein
MTSAARFASFLETHTMATLGPLLADGRGVHAPALSGRWRRRMSQDLPSTQNFLDFCRFELNVETLIEQPNQRIVTFI